LALGHGPDESARCHLSAIHHRLLPERPFLPCPTASAVGCEISQGRQRNRSLRRAQRAAAAHRCPGRSPPAATCELLGVATGAEFHSSRTTALPAPVSVVGRADRIRTGRDLPATCAAEESVSSS